jgi:salicylate hydroxylase
MTNTKIRLAIIGGGLAGATLANALIDIPHLIVHVFEAAPEFSERGAAVGLPTNALLALEKTVRSSTKVLEDAGGISIASTRMMIVSMSHLFVEVLIGDENSAYLGTSSV